jgi:hypothetical protein
MVARRAAPGRRRRCRTPGAKRGRARRRAAAPLDLIRLNSAIADGCTLPWGLAATDVRLVDVDHGGGLYAGL